MLVRSDKSKPFYAPIVYRSMACWGWMLLALLTAIVISVISGQTPSPHPFTLDIKTKACGQMRSGYFARIPGYRIPSSFKSYPVRSVNQCVAYCLSNPTCRSFNVRFLTPIMNGVNAKMCELSVTKMDKKSGDDDEWRHSSVEDAECDMYFMTLSPKRSSG